MSIISLFRDSRQTPCRHWSTASVQELSEGSSREAALETGGPGTHTGAAVSAAPRGLTPRLVGGRRRLPSSGSLHCPNAVHLLHWCNGGEHPDGGVRRWGGYSRRPRRLPVTPKPPDSHLPHPAVGGAPPAQRRLAVAIGKGCLPAAPVRAGGGGGKGCRFEPRWNTVSSIG